jgi:hypothetical protein
MSLPRTGKTGFEGYTPLPPGLLESAVYAASTAKIFGSKELTGKIFRTKDLSPEASPEGHSSPIDLYLVRNTPPD